MTRSFGLAAFGLLAWVFPAFATPSFSVTPSGTVSGQPGDTVGWGYSITNDTADVLLVSNTYFCQSGQDPLLTTCTQQLGAYNDFAASNTTEVAPSGAANQSFDATTFSGIGDYVISSLATPGQSDVGFLVLVYDLYTCDPLTDCGADANRWRRGNERSRRSRRYGSSRRARAGDVDSRELGARHLGSPSPIPSRKSHASDSSVIFKRDAFGARLDHLFVFECARSASENPIPRGFRNFFSSESSAPFSCDIKNS